MSTDYEPKFGAALPPDQMIQKYHSTDPHEGVDVRCDDGCGQDWRIHRMTFDEWWDSPNGWLPCDGARAISRRAFQAGAASRDAGIAELVAALKGANDLTEILRMPNIEHVADAHNKAVRSLRAVIAKVRKPT